MYQRVIQLLCDIFITKAVFHGEIKQILWSEPPFPASGPERIEVFAALEFPAEPEDLHVNVLLEFHHIVLPARRRRAVAGHPDHELRPRHEAPPAGAHDGLQGRVGL